MNNLFPRENLDHIVILSKKGDIMNRILDGRKTIESRWYVNRIAPWDRIRSGDTLYLKNSGESVIAKATVKEVLQYSNLNQKLIEKILRQYGKNICMDVSEAKYLTEKNYAILVFMEDVHKIEPFYIDKTGFGNACAWMSVKDVGK